MPGWTEAQVCVTSREGVSEQRPDQRAIGMGTGDRDLTHLGRQQGRRPLGRAEEQVRQSGGPWSASFSPCGSLCGSPVVFSHDDLHQLTYLKPDPLPYTDPSRRKEISSNGIEDMMLEAVTAPPRVPEPPPGSLANDP